MLQSAAEAALLDQMKMLKDELDARRREMEEMHRRWEAERRELLAAQAKAPEVAPPPKYGPMQDDESAEVC